MTRRKQPNARKDIDRPHYYVALGASAGGLEAIDAFFRNTPADTGMAFVVLQHLSPDYPSMMVELLSKQTKMPVLRAEDGMPVEANCVYLLPPKKNMALKDGRLVLTDQDRHRGLVNLPIDFFLESLATDQGELGIAIILSGTGSDGTQGIKAVKAAGGLIIAQAPDSAKFDGMPRSAQDTGLADYVLPPQDMTAQLLAFSRHPYALHDHLSDDGDDAAGDEPLQPKEELETVFDLLAEHYKVDFRHYKPNTLLRRIRRRIQVHQMASLGAYLGHLQADPDELSALYQELLIGVTSFFRDRPAWDFLAEEVMPRLIQDAVNGVLRLWSVGCSTGEEAYSLAILAHEACEHAGRSLEVKVFATDIDGEAILTAGKGVYPAASIGELPQALRGKYFTQQESTYTVNRGLRESVVFARQNVLSDPPFTNIDLISCRNLLIYFEPVLQKKAMSVFGFALHAGGALFLGKSESPGTAQKDYEVLDARHKLYRLLTRRMMMTGSMAHDELGAGRIPPLPARQGERRHSEGVMERLLTALTGSYLPLVIVVNEANQLVHLSGDTKGVFRLAEGQPTTDVSRLAHPDLALPLSTGLHKVFREHESVTYTNLRLKGDDKVELLNLHCLPLPGQGRGQTGLVAVVIERVESARKSAAEEKATFDLDAASEARIQDLESELQITRENLQAAVEELETSNEELQATNEELLSSNEELQSTNEELQSVNEELHTVNAEVVSKNTELVDLGKDVDDLLSSSEAALLLLDDQLNVRQYTPSLTRVFALQGTDVGRPITYVRHNLMYPDLVAALDDVSGNGRRFEKDVTDNLGNNYMLRILPTADDANKGDASRHRGVVLSLVDINERIAAEKVLRESEERFRLMVNALPGFAIHLLDPKGYVTTWNEAAQATTGFERRDVLGHKYDIFFDPDERQLGTPVRLLEAALAEGKAEETGWRVRRDGSRFWGNSVVSPLHGPNGELIGFVRIAQDRSAQRAQEQRVHKLSQAVEQSREQIIMADALGQIEYVNQAFLEQTGCMVEEVTGMHLGEKFADMLAPAAARGLQSGLQTPAYWAGEVVGPGPRGNKSVYHATLLPLSDANDQPSGFLMRLEDVTEAVGLEEALSNELEKNRTILRNASDGLAILDSTGCITDVSDNFCEMLGYGRDEMLGMHPRQWDARFSSEALEDLIGKCLQSPGRLEFETVHRTRDGTERPVEISATPFDINGETFLFTTTRDISQRKELEQRLKRHNEELEARVRIRTRELDEARQRAEELAQAKSAFLANMSHEIRTPMNAVLGLAYLLGQMDLPAEAAELARKIHSSGESLLGILNDILDLSKIEAGRLEIEQAPFDLGEVLDNLATIMATSAAGKGLELVIAPPPRNAAQLVGDALRLGQVLINLTSNAIKFTERGSVEVVIDAVGAHDDRIDLRFAVRDTGIGMDTATQARVFAPFQQADTSTTRRFGGTGLGLAISRRLVEMMGGEIALLSAPGEGSTFSFVLSLPRQHEGAVHPDELTGMRVLIADDNPISLEGLAATARSLGWHPELFEGGEGVVRRVLEDVALQTPRAALLLDWQMPDRDGTDAARAICEALPAHRRPLLLLVTAHGADRIGDLPYVEGIDAVFDKPTGPSQLYNAVVEARHARFGLPRIAKAQRQTAPRLAGLHLLVVDDSEINREVAAHIFGHEGAEISLAANGSEALDWLAAHPGTVDAVLMDVHMPVMDGLEATRRIRADEALAGVPVIALTAAVLQDQREAALAEGMSGLISKPFVTDSAVALILALTRHDTDATPASASAEPGESPVTAAPGVDRGLAIVNSEGALGRVKRPESYQRYLRVFVEQYRPLLDLLAAPDADRGELHALAHRLRGAAGSLGLERVAAAAGVVDAAFRRGDDTGDALARLHDDLCQALQAIADYLPTPQEPAAPPTTPDPQVVAPLLRRALAGLATLDPDAVDPELEELADHLPAAQLAPVGDALGRFSFDQAEAALRALAARLHIALED